MSVQAALPIPTALNNTDVAVDRYGAFARRWLDGMWRGDPLGDAVVASGARLVRRAIADGVDSVSDAPEALVALFAALDTPPAWMDADRCDRAAGHLARQNREYALVLGAASLLAGAQNTVAGKPLTFTGRYASNAATRSIEVGSWLMAVTAQGGLHRRSPGFERTVRVRMIHAHVRSHLSRHPDWDADAWGLPIPQAYMIFTLAEFCSIAVRAMTQIGVRYTDTELDDIIHLWRCVGHFVGIDDGLLPIAADDYARIEAIYALTSPGPDQGDRAFVAAMTRFQAAELARVLPASWTPAIIHGFQRAFIGDTAADDLAIPDTRCKHLPRVLGPLTATAYRAHDTLVPHGKNRRTTRAYRAQAKMLERLRKNHAVTHELVDDTT
jgi:hypothetical protein